MTTPARPHDIAALVRDPELPAAEVLLGSSAVDVLQHAVADRGGVVRAARPDRIDYWPGYSVSVRYDAVVETGTAASSEMLAAVIRSEHPEGARVVDVMGSQVAVWQSPDDPFLPGLATAVDAELVGQLLADAGVPVTGELTLSLLSYSPRSRAVVEVMASAATGKLVFRPGQGLSTRAPTPLAYVKVLRPSRAASVHRIHELLAPRLPLAPCLAYREELGLLVFAPLRGEPLWDCVVRGAPTPPDGHALMALLRSIEDVDLPESPRLSTTEAVHANAELLRVVAPSTAGVLDRFIERLGADAPQPEVTIHGDFHEVQLLVDEQGVCGVLDLDDAGRGEVVDDLGMMLGRLWAFGQTESNGHERIQRYTDDLLHTFGDYVDPHELRRRMAGIAMNHATGPFRFQERGWRTETVAAIERADRLLRELTGL